MVRRVLSSTTGFRQICFRFLNEGTYYMGPGGSVVLPLPQLLSPRDKQDGPVAYQSCVYLALLVVVHGYYMISPACLQLIFFTF